MGGGRGRWGPHAPARGLPLPAVRGRLLLHALDVLHEGGRQRRLLPLQAPTSSSRLQRANWLVCKKIECQDSITGDGG